VLCGAFQTSGEFAVKVMRMIDTYSLTCARQLVPGQQMTVVVSGIGQSAYCIWCSLTIRPTPSSLLPQCRTVVERQSLTGELSLSCARPAADG